MKTINAEELKKKIDTKEDFILVDVLGKVRPRSQQIGHSGFVSFARKI